MQIALGLWTFVHGAACLLIDEDYENVAPGPDVQAMIANAASRLLPLEGRPLVVSENPPS